VKSRELIYGVTEFCLLSFFSSHTDCIVTADDDVAETFMRKVDRYVLTSHISTPLFILFISLVQISNSKCFSCYCWVKFLCLQCVH
jgi:hypothetical protein